MIAALISHLTRKYSGEQPCSDMLTADQGGQVLRWCRQPSAINSGGLSVEMKGPAELEPRQIRCRVFEQLNVDSSTSTYKEISNHLYRAKTNIADISSYQLSSVYIHKREICVKCRHGASLERLLLMRHDCAAKAARRNKGRANASGVPTSDNTLPGNRCFDLSSLIEDARVYN